MQKAREGEKMKSKNTLEREMKSLLDWAKQQGEYPCYAVDYERESITKIRKFLVLMEAK